MVIKRPNTLTALVVIAGLIFVGWGLRFIEASSFVIDGQRYYSLFDDAMISMKYAWNFSYGRGLVWNSLDRVEGYTNPLWTLVMSLLTFAFEKSAAVYLVQLIGILTVLGVAVLSIKLANVAKLVDDKHKNFHAFLVAVLLLSYYPLSYWSLMGMETGFLTLLTVLSYLFALKFIRSGDFKDGYLMSLFLILMYLTRPDTIFISALIFGGAYLLCSKESRKGYLKYILFYLVALAAHTTFRYFYYHELVPNTATLKVFGIPLFDRLRSGFGFVKLYLLETSILLFLAFASVVYRPSKIKTFLFSSILIAIPYQIYVGGDPWYYWRFFVPISPILFLLASGELINLVKKYALCVLALVPIVFMVNERFLGEMVFKVRPFQAEYNEINVNYALKLKEISTEDATVGVVWAGAVPYYSERDGIDFLGKSDRYIAKVLPNLHWSTPVMGIGMTTIPGHNKYDLEYSIIKLKPDFIERADWGDQSVYNHPEFNYVTINYMGVTFLVREDSENVRWEKIN